MPLVAERHLYLIRHGHCDRGGGAGSADKAGRRSARGPGLSDTGREQAQLTAPALCGDPIDAIHCSTLRRAEETANIIAAQIPHVRVRRTRDLRECLPSVPTAFVRSQCPGLSTAEVHARLGADPAFAVEMERRFLEAAGYEAGAVERGKAQCNRAFARFFTPAARSSRHELLVAHGNILQELICRALGLDDRTWANLPAYQCGVTRVVIRGDGAMFLFSFNEVGHLPRNLRLF